MLYREEEENVTFIKKLIDLLNPFSENLIKNTLCVKEIYIIGL